MEILLIVALVVLVLYIIVTITFISGLLIIPPHYVHRHHSVGLSPQGKPIDPVWLPHVNNPQVDFGVVYHEVTFTAVPDKPKAFSPTLRGWHIPGRRLGPDHVIKGVIGVHGGGRDRREFHRFVPWLHEAGYDVLLFDYREHGISEGSGKGLDWGLAAFRDVLGAAQFARRMLHWQKVSILGTSNGATLGLLAAAHDTSENLVDCMIAESPYANPRDGMLDIVKSSIRSLHPVVRYVSLLPILAELIVFVALCRVSGSLFSAPPAAEDSVQAIGSRPVLLIHGARDRRFPVSHSKRIFERIPHTSKELFIVKEGRHTECWDADPNEYTDRVLKFLKRTL